MTFSTLTRRSAILMGLSTPVCASAGEGRAAAFDALLASGPAPEIEAVERPYDWLIGSWRARVVDYREDGSTIHNQGEWHFAWVLEGRAVQDVWISPPRAVRGATGPDTPNRYGTTIRFYDARRRQWRATWINPVTGAYDVLWARRSGADLVHEGVDADGRIMRWVFTDITAESARWYGERSADGGRTWPLEAEFFLTRDGSTSVEPNRTT